MRRYVIVGSGPAGIAAAEAIRSQDGSGNILLIHEETAGYYSRPGLAYYLTGEMEEGNLFPFAEADFQRLNLHRRHGRVTQIDLVAGRLALVGGEEIHYDRLLIATGATAAPLSLPGSQGEGVVKLDNLADARQLLKLARRARSAVVVGGGITALELVEGLHARKVKVHYFLRGNRYWSSVLDEAESRLVESRLRHEGIQIYYQTEIQEIQLQDGRVSGVLTQEGRLVRCDLVAFAVGVLPRKELAVSAGLNIGRGILVDEFMRTSHPGVFAAGDVAQVYDPFSGTSILDSLWGPARQQGRAAGLNMAAASADALEPYCKPVPFNVTRLAGLTVTIIGRVGGGRDQDLPGIARGDSETWRRLPDAIAAQSDFDVNRLRIMVGKNTLLGAVVIGDQTLSRPLQAIVANQVDISGLRARLLAPEAPLADILAEFWTQQKGRKTHVT